MPRLVQNFRELSQVQKFGLCHLLIFDHEDNLRLLGHFEYGLNNKHRILELFREYDINSVFVDRFEVQDLPENTAYPVRDGQVQPHALPLEQMK